MVPDAAGRDDAGGQGRDPGGAGALGDELGALGEQDHRLGDRVVIDHHHLVDPALHQRQGHLAWPLDRDAVRDRRALARGDRVAGAQRIRERSAAGRLHSDDPHL